MMALGLTAACNSPNHASERGCRFELREYNFKDRFDLVGSRIGGALKANGIKVSSFARLRSLEVRRDADFSGARFEGQFDTLNVQVYQGVSFAGARLNGEALVRGIRSACVPNFAGGPADFATCFDGRRSVYGTTVAG